MGKGHHQKASWELAAEPLVFHVRCLLDYRDAIEKALGRSLGRNEAKSRLRQLERLVEALEIELWHAGTSPDRTAAAGITTGLRRALGVVGVTIIGLVADDIYSGVRDALVHADRVMECVITNDGGNDGRTTDPTSTKADSAGPRAALRDHRDPLPKRIPMRRRPRPLGANPVWQQAAGRHLQARTVRTGSGILPNVDGLSGDGVLPFADPPRGPLLPPWLDSGQMQPSPWDNRYTGFLPDLRWAHPDDEAPIAPPRPPAPPPMTGFMPDLRLAHPDDEIPIAHLMAPTS